MTGGPTDGGAPAEAKATRPYEDPIKVLDTLVIELGRLAAERDFAKTIEDQADTDLSSPQGRVP
jgi:hypothetical protein